MDGSKIDMSHIWKINDIFIYDGDIWRVDKNDHNGSFRYWCTCITTLGGGGSFDLDNGDFTPLNKEFIRRIKK